MTDSPLSEAWGICSCHPRQKLTAHDTNLSLLSRKTIRNCLLGLNSTTRVHLEVSRVYLRQSDLHLRKNSCTSAIVTMQAAQDREGDGLTTFMMWWH